MKTFEELIEEIKHLICYRELNGFVSYGGVGAII